MLQPLPSGHRHLLSTARTLKAEGPADSTGFIAFTLPGKGVAQAPSKIWFGKGELDQRSRFSG
jgi:hypothetical protein